MRSGLLIGLVVAALAFPLPVRAEEAFEAGKRLFDAGDYPAAYDRFMEAFRADPKNLDASFYMGRAAFEAGDYEAAIMAFERVLIMVPDAQRVKLELARAYFKIGSRDIAREYFKSVQATNPPAAVWQQIQMFIDSIDAAERRNFFNGFLTVGGLYDSNVGAAPDLDSVVVGGLTVVLDQKEESDQGLNGTLVLNHVYRFLDTPYAWKSTFTSYNNWYDEETDYDLNFFALNTGLVRQSESSLWEVQALGNMINLDDERYLGVFGISLNHTRFLTRRLSLSLGGAYQDKTYYQDSARNSHTWTGSLNPVYSNDRNRFSIVTAYEDENTESDRYDYRRYIGSARYDRQLPFNFSVYLGFRYQETDYREEDPFFMKSRRDRQTTWEAGVSNTLWRSDDRTQTLAVQVGFARGDNDSNIDLYTYDKDLWTTTLTYAF